MLRTNTQVCLRGIKAYLKELTSSTLFFSRAPNANARAARLACQAPAIECRFSQIAHSRTTNTWSSSLMFPCYSLCQQETSTKRQKLQIQQLVVKLASRDGSSLWPHDDSNLQDGRKQAI